MWPHHEKAGDVHVQVAGSGNVLGGDVGFGAVSVDSHGSDSERVGVFEFSDGADAGQQQSGQRGTFHAVGGGFDPFPVGVAAGPVVEAATCEAVTVDDLDHIDPDRVERGDDASHIVGATRWRLCPRTFSVSCVTRREHPGAIRGSSAAEIAESIRGLIDSGSLAEGAALPPIRSLGTELGVNRNTVGAAYAQLAAAGLVETRRRGGTVVLGVPALDGEGRSATGGLVNLADGNPAIELLPDPRAAFAAGYVPPLYGHPPISERLAAWTDSEMAPEVGAVPRGFVLTHGAVDAVERLLSTHLTRGDAVAVEDPCFLSSIGTMRLNGYRSIPVAVDADGMTPDGLSRALDAGVRAVVCTPRAHNPTGASLTRQRAEELRGLLAKRPEVLVIEDDHFSTISARAYHRITPTDAPRWALVRSVSKFLGPDLRLAFVLSDEDSAAKLSTRLSSASWVSHVLQHIVATLLHDEETARLLQHARDSYAERLRSLTSALHEHGISLPSDRDGLNAWIPVGRRENRLVDALAARGWAVRGGSDFAVTGRGEGALRVTTSTITPQQAEAFAADLAAVLHSTKGT